MLLQVCPYVCLVEDSKNPLVGPDGKAQKNNRGTVCVALAASSTLSLFLLSGAGTKVVVEHPTDGEKRTRG